MRTLTLVCLTMSGLVFGSACSNTGPKNAAPANANSAGASSPSTTSGSAASSLDPNLRFVGRFLVQNDQVLFSWPKSSISVQFEGTQIIANMMDAASVMYQGKSVNNYFDVSVDGQAPTAIKMHAGLSQYVLAQNLTAGNHTLTLTKRTEAQVGVVSFGGFVVPDGHIVPYAGTTHARRLEFIGDSITCGYGCEASVTAEDMCAFGSGAKSANANYTFDASENVNKSYATLVADALDADVQVIAFSGKGVIQNLDPTSDPYLTLPVLYPSINPSNPNVSADASLFSADVVVINAGTNDYYNYSNAPSQVSPPDATAFTAGYLKLIQTVRGRYPKAYIVCALGPMLFNSQANALATTNIKSAITQAQSAGDSRITFHAFATLTGPTYGCDYHPNIAEHQAMASSLTQTIKTAMGW